MVELTLPFFPLLAARIGRTARLAIIAAGVVRRFLCDSPGIRLAVEIALLFFPPFTSRSRWAVLLAVIASCVSRRFFFFRFRLFYFRVFVEIGEQRRFFVIELIVWLNDVIEPLADRYAGSTRRRA
ncbi:MAG: hypothetical protein ABSE50_15640, partial [Xanthobacteraceae bacterium]